MLPIMAEGPIPYQLALLVQEKKLSAECLLRSYLKRKYEKQLTKEVQDVVKKR